jgi:bacillolysin
MSGNHRKPKSFARSQRASHALGETVSGRRRRSLLAQLLVIGLLSLVVTAADGFTASAWGAPSRSYHPETGKLRFIGSDPGNSIDRPPGLSATAPPSAVARAFLERYGKGFGIQDQARELRVTSSERASAGRSVVRFQQLHQGVPVLGGELIVNLDKHGDLLSANGEASPTSHVSVVPSVQRPAATEAALTAVAKENDVSTGKLHASEPSLWIYDARILGGPGPDIPVLVWRLDVTGEGKEPIDELVLIDARLGTVALHFSQVETAKDRWVCDANSTSSGYPCTAPVRTEGGPASAVQDVNDAYDFAGDTYDFYAANFGRDSLDDAGLTLKSTVRYCPSPAQCPFQNAFWDGEQMVYGAGFAAADDVVAHELTHGVTTSTSNLFYFYQSGAINESLSDVFGEFVDLTNGVGTDTAQTRWLLGEDIPGFGAGRDMENPPSFGDPDRMTSPNYTADVDERDNGGVHTNSGVNNKTAFLITDGGAFNGRTVTGLGIPKTANIYYEGETHLLTSASDYGDLFNALHQACNNLIGTAAITAADCGEVANATLATEMDQTPPAAPNPEAPVCSPGQSVSTLFLDDLENPASGNWALQTAAGVNAWFYPQDPNPIGLEGPYATSGKTNFWGYDQLFTADYSIAMTRSVAVPAGSTFLRFNHAYWFEKSASSAFDGGVVEYSTNGGASWSDAGPLFTDVGYNGTLVSTGTNPLRGRNAFTRRSNGYVSSRVSLSSLAGQNVRFRFRIGTDVNGDDIGWFVDDVRIYGCTTPQPPAPPQPAAPQPSGGSGASNGGAVSVDTVGPSVRIAASALKLDRRGYVGVKLSCPAGEPAGCTGTVQIKTAGRVRVSRKAVVTLGSARFKAGAGKTVLVRIKPSRKNRKLVKRLRRLKVKVNVVARDQASNPGRATRVLKLRAR